MHADWYSHLLFSGGLRAHTNQLVLRSCFQPITTTSGATVLHSPHLRASRPSLDCAYQSSRRLTLQQQQLQQQLQQRRWQVREEQLQTSGRVLWRVVCCYVAMQWCITMESTVPFSAHYCRVWNASTKNILCKLAVIVWRPYVLLSAALYKVCFVGFFNGFLLDLFSILLSWKLLVIHRTIKFKKLLVLSVTASIFQLWVKIVNSGVPDILALYFRGT